MTTQTTITTSSEQSPAQGTAMRAATIDRYGPADVITVKEVARPQCGPDEALIAVRAASINPQDWHNLTGTPLIMRLGNGLRRPKVSLLGVDVAGVVEAVGENVSKTFSVGDEVFGAGAGTFAEYVSVKGDRLVHKPAHLSFKEAAAVAVGALTAMQGLRDHGRIARGQRVLINGASGGVGTYAVQLAKHFGAEVTGVCSTRNVEMVRELGADHVIDYSKDDFTAQAKQYDLIFDAVGNRKMSHYKRCLSPAGCYVVITGPKRPILGPLSHMLKAFLAFKVGTRRAAPFIAAINHSDLELCQTLLASGEMRSVIDAVYPLDNIAEAFHHLETGHARGKIIVVP